tara:strand:- start:111 stop:503 length:393 start_codon:yes stop_codon:yes gene_type:complete
MVAALLWINAVGFVGMGLAGLLMPEIPVNLIGYELLGTDAAIEVRAQYGGLFIGIGVFAIWGALQASMWQASLKLMLLVYAGLALGRLTGLLLDGGSPGSYTYGATVFELFMVVAFGAALARGKAQPTGD